jgi:ABC-type lipoprotein release transport system permease subunit
MKSILEGVWSKMIENTLMSQAGHVEIHQKRYWDDKVIDNFMTMDAATVAALEKTEHVVNVSPRVETFAMASSEHVSKGIAVTGIDPAKESAKSNLSGLVTEGDYLTGNDDGILIGEGLAKYLKVDVGDTLALIGQGYHGASAAGLFPVRGVFRHFDTKVDIGMAYITLPAAQQFINLPDGYSGILISIDDNRALNATIQQCKNIVNPVSASNGSELTADDTTDYDVLPWTFTMERLLKTAESDKAFDHIMIFILYLIVGFGILGTVVMIANERKREFGVMLSLGMRRGRLAWSVSMEIVMMTLIGALLALLVTAPVIWLLEAHPIRLAGDMAKRYSDLGMEPVLPPVSEPSIYATQIIIVIAMTLLTLIYPVRKILKLKILNVIK